MVKLENYLSDRAYPGRGMIFGKTSLDSSIAAYFIMGRSFNSRNRIFEMENNTIHTKIFDESKVGDPSLTIYPSLRVCGNILIVSNGDQTDTIYSYVRGGHSYEDAVRTWLYEPDPPLFTPRISGVLNLADGSYKLSIIKHNEVEGTGCNRYFYEYEGTDGLGHLITTYDGNNQAPKTFSGEPVIFNVSDDIDEMTTMIWESLNEDNRVSLFVRYISLESKETITRIINKNR